jgi:hypothetical protein
MLPRERPTLWPSSQSSWLQIQRPGLDSRRYQIFWEVVGLERDPLSLVTIIEELLERKSSGSGLEIREYGRRDSSRWPRGSLYSQKLALTSPTSGGLSVGISRSRTQATEFLLHVSTVCSPQRWVLRWHKNYAEILTPVVGRETFNIRKNAYFLNISKIRAFRCRHPVLCIKLFSNEWNASH